MEYTRDDRAQASHRHPGRRGHRVLLRDPDVEAAVGEPLGEVEQAGRSGHARGDGDDLRVLLAELDQLRREGTRVRRHAAAVRDARLGVERADVVEALLLVGLRGSVPLALARERVHDDRAVDRGGGAQRGFERIDVVPVDRALVGETERREERAVRRTGHPQSR